MTEEGNSLKDVSELIISDKQKETIKFIGERNAIVFSANEGEPLPPVELSDEFFDLEKDDVRSLFKELKQNREYYENLQFRTKAVREMEESAGTLSRLRRYTQTVIRVHFPDRLVLQAVFNHSDTVQSVIDFVRKYLDPTDVQFYLYTAPPKSVLNPSVTLVEAKLTPRAQVYFSTDPLQDRTTFLQTSLMSSLTNMRLASEAALLYRREELEEKTVGEDSTEDIKVPAETPSCSYQNRNAPSTSKKPASANTKVPKWFKS